MTFMNRNSENRSKTFFKWVALITNIFFCTNSLIYAQPASISFHSPIASEVQRPSFINDFHLPAGMGTIQKTYSAGSSTVILIQDAHSQIQAQKSISSILEYLGNKHSVNTLFIEGGFEGRLPQDFLSFHQNRDVNGKLIDRLSEKGLVGGAGLYRAKQGVKVQGFGVEDPMLYTKNLKQFRSIYSSKSFAKKFVNALERKLLATESNISNSELKQFHREWMAHELDRRDAAHYYEYLSQQVKKCLQIDLLDPWSQFQFPQFVRFMSLQKLEKETNLKSDVQVQSEKSQLLHWVRQISSKSSSKLFYPKSIMLQAVLSGQQPSLVSDLRGYFEEFYQEFHPYGFAFEQYPSLSKNIARLILSQELNASDLLQEVNGLTEQVIDHLAVTSQEKDLMASFAKLGLLRKLFDLELTQKEYKDILKSQEELLPSQFAKRVHLTPNRFGDKIDVLFRHSLSFYQTASRREKIMFEHMMKRLRGLQAEKSALVIGGFHADGFQSLLEKNGFSYVTISPEIRSIEDSQKYLDAMNLKNAKVLNQGTLVGAGVDRLSLKGEFARLDPAGASYLGDVVRHELHDLAPKAVVNTSFKKSSRVSFRAPARLFVSQHVENARRSEVRGQAGYVQRLQKETPFRRQLRILITSAFLLFFSAFIAMGQIVMSIQQVSSSQVEVSYTIDPSETPGHFAVQETGSLDAVQNSDSFVQGSTWKTRKEFDLPLMTNAYSGSYSFNVDASDPNSPAMQFFRMMKTSLPSPDTSSSETPVSDNSGATNTVPSVPANPISGQTSTNGSLIDRITQDLDPSATNYVQLAWSPSPDEIVTGYNLYYKVISDGSFTNKVVVGNVLTAGISNLVTGVTYAIYATAYDAQGNESDPSNVVTYTPGMIGSLVVYAPALTNRSPAAVSGEKPSETSIWINGTEWVPLNSSTSWTASVPLPNEGTNTLSVEAKNAAGVPIVNAQKYVVLDTIAPSIVATSPSLVNQASYNFTYTVDGISATEARTLSLGTNLLTVTRTDAAGNLGALNYSVVYTPAVVNHAPVITPPASTLTVTNNIAFNGSLTASDIDGDPLVFQLVTPAVHGNAVVNANGTFSYTAINYTGFDSFTFRVNDGKTNSAVATVNLNAVAANAAALHPFTSTNMVIDSSIALSGGSSGFFNGTNSYATAAPHADWALGANDFAIEIGLRPTVLPAMGKYMALLSDWVTGQKSYMFFINQDLDANNLPAIYLGFFYSKDGNIAMGPKFPLPASLLNQWHVVKVTRTGPDLKFFFDGGQIGTTYNVGTDSFYPATASPLMIGAANNGATHPFIGYLDKFNFSGKAQLEFTNAEFSNAGTNQPNVSIVLTSAALTNNSNYLLTYTVDGVAKSVARTLVEGINSLSVSENGAVQVFTVTLDTQAPAIVFTSPAVTNNASYLLSYTADGVAKTSARTLVQGVNNLNVTEVDAAGNSTNRTFAVTLDTIAPVVQVISATNVTMSSYVLTWIEDGITKTRNETLVSGDNALTVTATDNAGNSTTVIFHVQYTGGAAVVTGHALSVTNVAADSINSKFGGTSFSFSGTNSHLDFVPSTDWALKNNPFFINTWVKPSQIPDANKYMALVSQWVSGQKSYMFFIQNDGANIYLGFFYSLNGDVAIGNKYPIFTVDQAASLTGQFHHVAVTRNSAGDIILFFNGIEKGRFNIGAETSFFNANTSLMLGAAGLGTTHPFIGNMDELYFSNGTAGPSSNFSVPAGPYTEAPATGAALHGTQQEITLGAEIRSELRQEAKVISSKEPNLFVPGVNDQRKIEASISVARVAERTVRSELRRFFNSMLTTHTMNGIAESPAIKAFEAVLQGVFPERTQAARPTLTEHEIDLVMQETGLSREEILSLAEVLLAAPAHSDKVTDAVSFIPVDAQLSLDEQQELFQSAARELKQFQGKAAILVVSSSKMTSREIQALESQADGRLAIIVLSDNVISPSQFIADFFDSSVKQDSLVVRKIHAAIQAAYEKIHGTRGPALKKMMQHALVVAAPSFFNADTGNISRVPQQFLGSFNSDHAGDLYKAHLIYAIRIGGYLAVQEIPESLRQDLVIQSMQGQGASQIKFSTSGLSRVLGFLQALSNARHSEISA